MAKNLVIVESPAKASTIEKFLGKDFKVKSSFGHVRDLKKKGIAIDIENNFQPTYEVSEDKKKVVADLKKEAKSAELVWLATDSDREGEAISWHLWETLKLKKENSRRITFNEITKSAVQNAVDNPREIDINLVDAQQARRVLDRLVGFELSPVLWKKIKPSLSAGRVQSVTVRLIVEREREIQNFKEISSYKIAALFLVDGKAELKAETSKKFAKKGDAEKFLNECATSDFTIADLKVKPAKRSPAAPFTTSTLQQEASRKLGFSVTQTMVVAQKLYEAGKITYMRTDSLNLGDQARAAAAKEITNYYGKEYSFPRVFKTKSKGAQEAHEAIRPTDMIVHKAGGDSGEQRLYDLIWKRTLASQMSEAQLEKTTVDIAVSNSETKLVAHGEVVKFDGFLKVYLEGKDDGEEEEQKGMLPPLKVGQELALKDLTATERFTHHPPRFTEASLVKQLEERGIGRPSTYAPTITTVQKRGYVSKDEREGRERKYTVLSLKDGKVAEQTKTETTGAEKNKLQPTDIGIVVNDFLVDHFPDVLDYNFTASVEKEFDEIAEGNKEWNKMIKDFYKPFHNEVQETLENAERASGERILGTDPKTGKQILVRVGRFGPLAQIGESGNEDDKPKFASLLKHQSLESITLEEALDLFKLPRTVGMFEDKEVVIGIGRFGPYIRHDGKFTSIKKSDEEDPMTITLDRSIELIKIKRQADIDKFIKTFPEDETVQVLNGRWGPYIKIEKKNFKIPKDVAPESLTLEECIKISKNQPKKGARKPKAKKK
jgi:DNA topoisomerase-1